MSIIKFNKGISSIIGVTMVLHATTHDTANQAKFNPAKDQVILSLLL